MTQNAKRRGGNPALQSPSSDEPNMMQPSPGVNGAVAQAVAELGTLGPPMAKLIRALLAEHTPEPAPGASDIVDGQTLCQRLCICAPTLRAWVTQGCPSLRRGAVRRYSIVAVTAWLATSGGES